MNKAASRETTLPFLLKFKQPLRSAIINYSFNSQRGLNIAYHKGELVPVVCIPNSKAMIKTLSKLPGED